LSAPRSQKLFNPNRLFGRGTESRGCEYLERFSFLLCKCGLIESCNFSIRIDFIAPLPDYFGVMLLAILPIATTFRMVRQVPAGAASRAPTTRLFDTGTISRYFSYMGLRSPGYPSAFFAHFPFLFLYRPNPSHSTIIATVPLAADT